MFYEINIALNGRHFFATAERSITDRATLKNVYSVLSLKFPKDEGYEISVTQNTETMRKVDPQAI